MIKHGPTGIPYARLDGVHSSIRRHRDNSDWRDAYIDHLIKGEYDAAHELRLQNDPRYEEECREEAEEIFPVESAPLRSCAEVASEQDEEVEALDSTEERAA